MEHMFVSPGTQPFGNVALLLNAFAGHDRDRMKMLPDYRSQIIIAHKT